MSDNPLTLLVRHGEHVDNKLTPKGVEEVDAAAGMALTLLADHNIKTVVVVTSEAGRAKESAGQFVAKAMGAGIEVQFAEPNNDPAINPARGLGPFLKKASDCPPIGEGALAYWRNIGQGDLPDSVETYESVGDRSEALIHRLRSTAPPNSAVVAYSHSGTIEPCLDAMYGIVPRAIPSASFVAIFHDGSTHLFDPNEEL